MIILGIDPGYDRVGVGIIERSKSLDIYVFSDCIETDKNDTFVNRLSHINRSLSLILNQYRPDLLVIESLFFAKNVKTAIDVAQARGSILLTLNTYIESIQTLNKKERSTKKPIRCVSLLELTPMQVKSSLVGNGHADKKSVSYMVYQILKLDTNTNFINKNTQQNFKEIKENIKNKNKILDDEIDALSIALAGCQYQKLAKF